MKVDFKPLVSFKAEQTNILAGAKPVIKPQEPDTFVKDDAKIEQFKSRLNDPEWKKEYLPQANIVYIKHKNIIDGLEYEISADGTVREVGCWVKPTVIMNPNQEMAEYVEKTANPYNVKEFKNETINNSKSFKDSVKTGIANIWKFFSVSGTMAYAGAKGALYGATIGALGLLTSMVVRAPKLLKAEGSTLKTLITHPFKSAGTTGTILSTLAGLATMAGFIVDGKMRANQNSSVIEHKMDVAHVND